MDKSWVHHQRSSKEFHEGLCFFLNYAFESGFVTEDNKVKCPCKECANVGYKTTNQIYDDVVSYGMLRIYTLWYHHGENFIMTFRKNMLSELIQNVILEIKQIFSYPEELEHWVLTKVNDRWRDHKFHVKKAANEKWNSVEERLANPPNNIVESQWRILIEEISNVNKQNREKQNFHHTTGSKPHAKCASELAQKLGPRPKRHEVFGVTHTKKKKLKTHIKY